MVDGQWDPPLFYPSPLSSSPPPSAPDSNQRPRRLAPRCPLLLSTARWASWIGSNFSSPPPAPFVKSTHPVSSSTPPPLVYFSPWMMRLSRRRLRWLARPGASRAPSWALRQLYCFFDRYSACLGFLIGAITATAAENWGRHRKRPTWIRGQCHHRLSLFYHHREDYWNFIKDSLPRF